MARHVNRGGDITLQVDIKDYYFRGIDPRNCSHFGCGVVLTPEQSLYGDKCVKHSGKPKEIISKFKGRQPTGKL